MLIILFTGFCSIFVMGVIFIVAALKGYGLKRRMIVEKKKDKEADVLALFSLGLLIAVSGGFLVLQFFK